MVATPAALAQSANATLRGHAPAGAQVTATNVATGATRKVGVATDGSYALVGLAPVHTGSTPVPGQNGP
jgi:hypothetical protein